MIDPKPTDRAGNDPPASSQDSRPEADRPAGHALPFGEGVYGLGRQAHGEQTGGSAPGSEEPGSPPPEREFDFARLAEELGMAAEGHADGRQCVGWCPVCRSAEILRAVATPELRSAWRQFAGELALALKAAADQYAGDRVGPGEDPDSGERVTEIPID